MVDYGVHHGDRILIVGIMATIFVDMLVLVRHFIIVVPGTQGDTKAGPNRKAVLFGGIKSINATMPEVHCQVVPLEGNWVTKVNEEGGVCHKAIVINVGTRCCGRGKEDIAKNGVGRVKPHAIEKSSPTRSAWQIWPSGGEHFGTFIALPLWQGAIRNHSGKNWVRVTHPHQNELGGGVNESFTTKRMTGINPLNSRSNSKMRLLFQENVRKLTPVTNVGRKHGPTSVVMIVHTRRKVCKLQTNLDKEKGEYVDKKQQRRQSRLLA